MAKDRELYTILGLDDSASDSQIRQAYEALSQSPELGQDEKCRIEQAYSVLSDMEKRASYDITGKVRFKKNNRRPQSVRTEKVRYSLNTLFLVGATVTTVLFILQWCGYSTTPFYWACGISIAIKLAEYIMRLIP